MLLVVHQLVFSAMNEDVFMARLVSSTKGDLFQAWLVAPVLQGRWCSGSVCLTSLQGGMHGVVEVELTRALRNDSRRSCETSTAAFETLCPESS